jgi:hypothetical protein
MATVNGFDPAASGQQPLDGSGQPLPVGVWGDSDSGVGVFGSAGVTSPTNPLLSGVRGGVVGHGGEPAPNEDPQWPHAGVVGHSTSGCGLVGFSNTGLALYAVTQNDDNDPTLPTILSFGGNVGIGVMATCHSGDGVVGQSNAEGTGVRGSTVLGTGVLGEGYAGRSNGTPTGVTGLSDKGVGVRGDSQTGTGVQGLTLGDGYGVSGVHFSTDPGSGVFGMSVLGSGVEGFTYSEKPDTAAVRGQARRPGLAGLFVGDVMITGRITKGGGGFHIDHPLAPLDKTLTHSFVESPEMLNVYSGTVTTDSDGAARVSLPDYFDALNSDVRYQLTTIGSFARVMISEEVKGNEFAIASDEPNVKVCWQVTGVRHDAWAQTHRIQVEHDKPKSEQGTYIHPEAFDPESKGHAHTRSDDAVAAALPEHLHGAAADVLSGPAESRLGELVSDAREHLEQRAADGRSRTGKWGRAD